MLPLIFVFSQGLASRIRSSTSRISKSTSRIRNSAHNIRFTLTFKFSFSIFIARINQHCQSSESCKVVVHETYCSQEVASLICSRHIFSKFTTA